jgi:hypothetical protein
VRVEENERASERERERESKTASERAREREREQARERERGSDSDAPAHSLARKMGGVGGEGAGEVEGRAAVSARERPRVQNRRHRLCRALEVHVAFLNDFLCTGYAVQVAFFRLCTGFEAQVACF